MNSKLLYLISQTTVVGNPIGRISQNVTNQLVTTASSTVPVIWDTFDFAINNMVSGPAGFTVPLQGYYLVNATMTFGSASTGYTDPLANTMGIISVLVDGILTSRGSEMYYVDTTSAGPYASVVSDVLYIDQGGTVSAEAFGSIPSGSLYSYANDHETFFSLAYICA
jgi:hypothetical protein